MGAGPAAQPRLSGSAGHSSPPTCHGLLSEAVSGPLVQRCAVGLRLFWKQLLQALT